MEAPDEEPDPASEQEETLPEWANGGHALGTSSSPSASRPSKDEVRRRRLEALSKSTAQKQQQQQQPQQQQPQTQQTQTQSQTLTPKQSTPSQTPPDSNHHQNQNNNNKRPPPSPRKGSPATTGASRAAPPSARANPWLAEAPTPQPQQQQQPPQEDSKKPKVAFGALPPGVDDEDADLQRALAMSLLSSSSQPPPTTTMNHPQTPPTEEEDEEFDPDLAAALRLSMEPAAAVAKPTPTTQPQPHTTTATTTTLPPPPDVAGLSPRVRGWYESAEPTNVLDAHFLLWDDGVTTENDQKRWLAQGIDFKNAASETPAFARDSLLSAVICNQAAWGLTQSHGGPCGVLASLQAEFLRLLLFGPRTPTDDHNTNNTTNNDLDKGALPLHVPTQLTNHFCRAPPDLSQTFLRKTLALAMGIILARAAVQPPAARNDDKAAKDDNDHVTPMETDDDDHHPLPREPPRVRIVLPIPSLPPGGLAWEHLAPWSSARAVGGGRSEHLVTHTISLDDNGTAAASRSTTGEEEQEELLAQATAAFLLETDALPRWFQGSGGVLLFLMSLALSRGIANVQGDMDDATARLTSQFGHCGQELLNLLLTGQAVSNVFDHTLRPSGELICRGIQKGPAIGYLTQLESMRYLEVGGYYKTPRFPIWVVGSTSHFTVMFGDAACLHESKADALLEKVRRAFKKMDGGAENGFLRTDQLAAFLDSLGLLARMGDHGAQALAATLEVSGILLWEDVWKRVSRLMTGASLASVLEWEETPPPPPPPLPAATTAAAPLSDEEYARRLQAELNGEVLPPAPAPSPAPASSRAETFGPTFQLYHYNGLRGGNMKPFRVTRLSADEAIGASVSLGASGAGGILAGGADGGMEDVLRTKWPSCKINWLSGDPPSID